MPKIIYIDHLKNEEALRQANMHQRDDSQGSQDTSCTRQMRDTSREPWKARKRKTTSNLAQNIEEVPPSDQPSKINAILNAIERTICHDF